MHRLNIKHLTDERSNKFTGWFALYVKNCGLVFAEHAARSDSADLGVRHNNQQPLSSIRHT